ncbi:ATP-dependent Clp protease ATP-binding subunit, partial [Enterococcus faecium]|nr:ATP-dependent Clp protease ATP-binding subunit [Enterococcus faecium]
FPLPHSDETNNIHLLIAKIKNFTNGFSLEKTLEDFLIHLKTTDSDLLDFTQKIINTSTKKRKEPNLPSEIKSMGYFFSNKPLSVFSGRIHELDFVNLTTKRKIKNNLLIVGEPGTGKTTLIHQFSKQSDNPIFVVEMNKIISDTKYRGEFESKFTMLIEAALDLNFIIFIDEIHILLGAGKVDGGFSGADIIKPYITNPEIILFGATTKDEYKIIMKDTALERRFNVLFLNEVPKDILYQIYLKLLEYLNISTLSITDFDSIINQLDEIHGRNYPDKLIDYLDFYAANEQLGNKFDMTSLYKE